VERLKSTTAIAFRRPDFARPAPAEAAPMTTGTRPATASEKDCGPPLAGMNVSSTPERRLNISMIRCAEVP